LQAEHGSRRLSVAFKATPLKQVLEEISKEMRLEHRVVFDVILFTLPERLPRFSTPPPEVIPQTLLKEIDCDYIALPPAEIFERLGALHGVELEDAHLQAKAPITLRLDKVRLINLVRLFRCAY
jgi:hypothetical protein